MRPQPRTQSLDLCSRPDPPTSLFKEESSLLDLANSSDPFMSFSEGKTDTDSTSGIESIPGKEGNTSNLKKLMDNAECVSGRGSIERFLTVSDTVCVSPTPGNGEAQQPLHGSTDGRNSASPSRTDSTDPDHQCLLSDQGLVCGAAASEGDGGLEPCEEGAEGEGGPMSPGDSQASRSAVSLAPADTSSKAEQQDKKKGEV